VNVSRRRGRLRLRLDPIEARLLSSLLDQLDAVLDGPDGDGAEGIRRRLFPDAYRDDPDAEREYRSLTRTALRDERDERIAACRADLAAGGDVDLTDAEVARRWIQVLNDLRLAVGTRIGVTEDDYDADFDPDDPDSELRTLYFWLTMLQESVVTALRP
jgi:hypothetical protein